MKPGDRVYVRMNAPPYTGTFRRIVIRLLGTPQEVEKEFKFWYDPIRTTTRAEVVRVNTRTVLVRLDSGMVVKRRRADVVSIPV